ncbi:putative PurR-regulated permease PerM [Pseudomonas sp. PvR086]|mgnify:CR=1 FL=1|jgi:predicted PurR-regulated permease PerM|uniref:AI-2E family transporter n=1 Tax=Pseudomonas TaxID=286 RepID=UPI00037CC766|nr:MULTISPECIES: AI-2E family transporter [Pseudomonas]ANI61344.1 membrane protein [Pseudomonas sp. GR 6-02]MBD9607689.1 AI-2E family transporter [Pseudomonas sp. PDM08]MBD9616594.1 AI-2E family transporter [Pseudomonas sp. PDM07]MDR7105789.1 putative PurR-regulated permease PerM [Pseudomonas frederiksbergensis]PMY50548.1 AI-2E family transporter [Pseudomonas sp. FW305-53]
MNETKLQNTSLMVLLAVVTVAFVWILLPFYGAVFWAAILGILFAPLQHQLQLRFGWSRNLTALCTLSLCVLIAILPVIIISTLLVQEGAALYGRIESGELDIAGHVSQFKHSLPPYFQHLLDRFGMGELSGLREKIIKSMMQGSQFLASQAFSFGQGTFDFVVGFFIMLYLLFFFLRDGSELARKVRAAIPLEDNQKRRLQLKFNRVVRATVKGSLLVSITQGALGGLIFWFLDIPSVLLWAVLMAFLSLLPAVGAGIVWVPVAAYFLLSGAIWQGTVLALFGVFVIGLVDNILRPILVGKDTKMPDYLILISTLGGLAIFGLNGFVIGPLIAALFMSSWAIFVDTKQRVQLP